MSASTYTLLKNGVDRPVELNFVDGYGIVRFQPYQALYVDESRFANDALTQAQLREYLETGVLRVVGLHLVPSEITDIDDVVDEIIKGRESNTRGVTFLSLDDRMEAMENDLLDVVTVAEQPDDEFNVPSDVLYQGLRNELDEAMKHPNSDYVYPSLKARLDAIYNLTNPGELTAIRQSVDEILKILNGYTVV